MTASTDQKFDLAAALKQQQWERCKGELRAMVALQSSYHSVGEEGHAYVRMVQASKMAEEFIKEFYDEGLAD